MLPCVRNRKKTPQKSPNIAEREVIFKNKVKQEVCTETTATAHAQFLFYCSSYITFTLPEATVNSVGSLYVFLRLRSVDSFHFCVRIIKWKKKKVEKQSAWLTKAAFQYKSIQSISQNIKYSFDCVFSYFISTGECSYERKYEKQQPKA